MSRRDVGNEFVVALVVIGVLALALTFGIVLTLTQNANPTPAALAGTASVPPTVPTTGASATFVPSEPSEPTVPTQATDTAAPTTPAPSETPLAPTATRAQLQLTPLTPLITASDTQSPTATTAPTERTESTTEGATGVQRGTTTESAATTEPTRIAQLPASATATRTPSPRPTSTSTPSRAPSLTPTFTPSATFTFTASPTNSPTSSPTSSPTVTVTASATLTPSHTATNTRTATATASPTPVLTATPTLFIPTPLPDTPTPEPLPTSTPFSNCVPRRDWPTYQVQPGDTLFSIARRAGIRLADLLLANCISDPNNLIAGLTLRVPPGSPILSGTPAPPPTVALSGPNVRDCDNPAARIVNLTPGGTVRGTVPIIGTANIADFSFYKVEIQLDDGSPNWVNLLTNPVPVESGVLVRWNTVLYPPGVYWVALTAVDKSSAYPPPCQIRVIVAP